MARKKHTGKLFTPSRSHRIRRPTVPKGSGSVKTKKQPESEAIPVAPAAQGSEELCASKIFINLIKEISGDLGKEDLEWEESAMAAVQQAAEEYLVELFNHTQRAAVHAGRITIRPEDMKCMVGLRGIFDRLVEDLGNIGNKRA